jgi:hypothetical protein
MLKPLMQEEAEVAGVVVAEAEEEAEEVVVKVEVKKKRWGTISRFPPSLLLAVRL